MAHMNLFIDTVSEKKQIIFFDAGKAAYKRAWTSRGDEGKKVFEALSGFFGESSGAHSKKPGKRAEKTGSPKLKKILVVTGPGGFSAARVGITAANTIAFARRIPLIPLDLEALKKVQGKGSNFILGLTERVNSGASTQEMAAPVYDRPPSITESKKCEGIFFTS